MRISKNWLLELVDLSHFKNAADLAEVLTQRGLEVEDIIRLDQGFEKVVTAQILEKRPHPQADRLSLCEVTIGQGPVLHIVCGAQNMKAGDKVALAQIGAVIPNGLKIEASKIRGEVSQGMLCSEEELKLKSESEGILILPPETPLGQPLAKILGRDDVVFVLKITPNRGDCLSHIGIAREIAAALGTEIKLPSAISLPSTKSPISVYLDAGDLAPQFFGCSLSGVKIGPSPEWVARRLEAIGVRSINTVVDATNLIMFETGHPLHAYDATSIQDNEIRVRLGVKGEQLPLLDGTTVTLEGTELVIADSKRAIGLAGVMGGGNSEVQSDSQNLFLECAEFDPGSVRKAAAKHQHRSEASQRFEKGIDPKGLGYALSRLATLILELSGGEIQGFVQAQIPSRMPGATFWEREIRYNRYYVRKFLGFDLELSPLTEPKIESILKGLGCEVKLTETEWHIRPPSFRPDLQIKEDIAEEIARSLGYDQIPSTLPKLTSSPSSPTSAIPRLSVIDRAKEALVQSGLHEVIHFAFTNCAWLEKLGFSSNVPLLNPLSEEHSILVPSLLPGLIQSALNNWHHHFGSEPLAIRLFEIRPTFSAEGKIQAQNSKNPAAKGPTETGVAEQWKISFLVSGPKYSSGLRSDLGEVEFSDMKAIVDHLFTQLGSKGVRYQPLSASRSKGNATYKLLLHPGQSVEVLAGPGTAGYFGLLHPAKAKELKCRAPLWIAELDWESLSKFSRGANDWAHFKPWPPFPPMERDFALLVKNEVTMDKICHVALKYGKPLAKSAKVFDIYKGSQVSKEMTSIAVRVIFYHETRSLQEIETEEASAQIIEGWKKELSIELRT